MGCRHGWSDWHDCGPCDDWAFDRPRRGRVARSDDMRARGWDARDDRAMRLEDRLDALREDVRRLERELAARRDPG